MKKSFSNRNIHNQIPTRIFFSMRSILFIAWKRSVLRQQNQANTSFTRISQKNLTQNITKNIPQKSPFFTPFLSSYARPRTHARARIVLLPLQCQNDFFQKKITLGILIIPQNPFNFNVKI